MRYASVVLSFAFLALVFSTLTFAVDIDPKQVGAGVFDVNLQWEIDTGGQQPSTFSFSTFGFFQEHWEQVQFTTSRPYTETVDEFGNSILKFQLDPSLPRQTITLTARISSLPEQFDETAPADLEEFKRESDYVAITPAIAAKAAEIAGQEANPLKKAALLTEWVHNNVVYDLAYKDQILTSTQVYDIRRGVCNEYSHLLLAMLRSQGIPARFVAGYVYSGEVWAPHAWVEVAASGKWFPFDPTYSEGMVIDATHLKFAQGVDQSDVREQLTATGQIDLAKVSITRGSAISILSTSNFSSQPLIELTAPNEIVAGGSIQPLSARVTNRGAKPIAYPASLSLPDEVKVLGNRTYLTFLFPGETAQLSWSVLIPADLQPGFLYTYPIVLRSLGAVSETSIQAKHEALGQQQVQLIEVKEIRLVSQQPPRLIATIQNSGNTPLQDAVASLEVGNFNSTQLFSVQAGETATLGFPLPVGLNFSATLVGSLAVNSTQLALIQLFSIQPAVKPEPPRPEFSIETSRGNVTQTAQQMPFTAATPLPLYAGLAITVLIMLLLIISKTRQ